jgi:Mg-chelatase subunit ChlD
MKIELNETKRISHVAMIIDESGSMYDSRYEAISAFNGQIKAIKSAAREIPSYLSVVCFNEEVKTPKLWAVNVKNIKTIDIDDYQPDGWTALRDAIGYTVERLEREFGNDKDAMFLIVVITDGYENMSKRYTSQYLSTLISRLETTGKWTFTFIGANVDFLKMKQDYNFNIGNSVHYDVSPRGFADMTMKFDKAINNYYATSVVAGASCSNFFEEDKTTNSKTE